MLTIGIDPDLQKCGVGIVKNGRVVDLEALHLFQLMTFIDEHVAAGALFILEDVEAIKPTFPRNVTPKVRDNISQKVGQVKAIARLVKMYLDQTGANYRMIKPLGGPLKAVKKNAALFERYTGWTKRSNEDQRDAAMLALFGTRERRLADVACG